MARSSFYPRLVPEPSPPPHVEWYRPRTRKGLLAALKTFPARDRPGIRRHFEDGGSLVRPVPDAHNAGIEQSVAELRGKLEKSDLGDAARREIERAISTLEGLRIDAGDLRGGGG